MSGAAAKTAFLFKAGRQAREGKGSPTEFLYGYCQLKDAGWPVELLQDDELGFADEPSRLCKAVNHLGHVIAGVPLRALALLLRPAARARLNAFDNVIVGTNTFGVCLALMKALGLLRPRVLFIAMGLCDQATPPRHLRIYRRLLRHVTLAALAKSEVAHLGERLGGLPVRYLPFGVDAAFWTPGPAADEPYVLSIGNDRHRDYQTLVAAWKPSYPKLRIVTRLPVETTAANIELVRGDWHKQLLTDEAVRDLMRGAMFAVLPMRQTIQPSGQSACLQMMACGKAVVLSDIDGLWDRALMRDGESCILASPPGDGQALQAAIERLISDPAKIAPIGLRARQVVASELNVDAMAAAIGTLLTAAE